MKEPITDYSRALVDDGVDEDFMNVLENDEGAAEMSRNAPQQEIPGAGTIMPPSTSSYDNNDETGEYGTVSPQDTFDAESDIWEYPGELQHGAAIAMSETGSIPQRENIDQQQEEDNDNSTISFSRQPEIVVGEEDQSVDLSSVGMGSATQWEETQHNSSVPVLPLHFQRAHQQRLRHYSWNPSSSRGRSGRWDGHPTLAMTRPIAKSTRQTAPAVLREQQEHDVESQPLSQHQDESSSSTPTNRQIVSSSSTSALAEETTSQGEHDSTANGSKTHSPLPPTSITSPYTLLGAPDSKYPHYHCVVDSSQDDRAVEIQLGSMARPHMRAFHLAWMAFFVAFFTWFALTPLLSEIAISLSLSKEEIWTSSILGVAGSAVTRILIGPICDKYGSRWAMGLTLFLSAIPMALTGLVQTGIGLSILRLFIGLAGSAFVTSQYWTSSMFTVEVAGTANALVAGWGNLGGGVTQIVMGSLVFPILKIAYGGDGWSRAEQSHADQATYDRASDLAWRTSCVVPALMCFVMTYFVIWKADDCPKGNYSKRNREGLMPSVSVRKSVVSGMRNINTWILFIQYGCCFGAEITMINAAALYFKEEFGLSTELSAAVASIFGWMNLFARGLGGFLSDICNAKFGMRGRLWVQTVTLLVEGALIIIFSTTHTLGGAIVVMISFSIFVQAAEGSTFSIVPYVNPPMIGSVSGVVGAGGNVGGVVFATIFRAHDYREAFFGMGFTAMISALLTIPIAIPGHASLFCGSDAPEVLERRTAHIEEMGNIPSVVLQQDQDDTRRSSVVDRDTSRRSTAAIAESNKDPDSSGSRRSRHSHATT